MNDLIRILPAENESLLGFLRRYGHMNAYRHTADFLSRINVRYGRQMVEELPALASALDVDNLRLSRISPSSNPTTASLEWAFHRHHSDPFCPKCSANGQVFEASWRHALVSACPHHGTRLVDRCPICASQFTPVSGGYETCSCGAQRAEIETEPAPEHETAIARLISGSTLEGTYCAPFDDVNPVPADIGGFLHFLASSFSQNRTGKTGKTRLPKTVSESVALLEPVAKLLHNWPHGFEDHVSERLTASASKENSAPAKLGKWYHRLMKFKEPAYDPFRSAVARVVAEEFNGSYVGAIVVSSQREWVSAKEASAELNISPQRLVEAVQKKHIAGKQSQSGYGHTHTVIPRLELVNIAADRDRYCSGLEVQRLLGIHRKQFELLREAGVVSEVAVQHRPALVDGGFDRVALLDSITKLRSSADHRPGDTVKLFELNLRRTTDRSALLHLFRLVFECKIRPVVADEDMALSSFEFLKSEIDDELSTLRFSRDWTAHDVAKIAGWKPQSVVHWCRLGLLEARQVQHGPNLSYLISPEQLARFQATFVPVATLAKSRGTSSRKLMESLADREIPTHGAEPEGRTSRGHLVRLSDLLVTGGDDAPNRRVCEDPRATSMQT
ncbi:TniQ family protein [Ruegeria profundi]|nr:TniQ family protein [Ruegeria profundi]